MKGLDLIVTIYFIFHHQEYVVFVVSWMEKAIDAYWQYRIDGILTQVGTGQSDEKTLQSWEQLLDEMYGENEARKKEILDIHLENHKISRQGKL